MSATKVLLEGVPVIKENTCCWFLCQVKEQVQLAGRTVFLAEVVAGSDVSVGTPMVTYRYYVETGRRLPRKSPTLSSAGADFRQEQGEALSVRCAAMYQRPNFGFEELPHDWTCPICKMPKKATFVRKK